MCHGYIRDVLLPSTGGRSTAHSAWFRGCNSFCLYITGVQYCCYGDGLKWAGNFILIKFCSWAEEEGSISSIAYGIFCLGHTFCKQQQTWRASCIFPPDASTWKHPLRTAVLAQRAAAEGPGRAAAPELTPTPPGAARTPAPRTNGQNQRGPSQLKSGKLQLKRFVNFNWSKNINIR